MARRPQNVVLVLVALVLLVTGCGGSATPPERPVTPIPYVALGDSYSAAPGVPTTDLAGGCFRSSNDYPHLLARAVRGVELTDVTCSAASTASLAQPQRIAQVSVPPQLDALTSAARFVTLGIGGNDGGLFSAVLDSCMNGEGTCRQRLGPQIRRDLPLIQQHVTEALQEIHRRAPSAKVVLVGYPQLVPTSGSCAQLPVKPADRGFVHRLMIDLSTRLAAAAAAGEATYVDLLGPSQGHDICSSSPWVNGAQANGGAIEFHPYLAEQKAVAALVAKALPSPAISAP